MIKMSYLLPLRFTACQVVVQVIMAHEEDTNTKLAARIIRLLQSDQYTAVSETILKHVVERHPSLMSNDLLRGLVPPHVREISLKGCVNVSAAGLEDTYNRYNLTNCHNIYHFFKQVSVQIPVFLSRYLFRYNELIKIVDVKISRLLI